jgi:hypothetical protein
MKRYKDDYDNEYDTDYEDDVDFLEDDPEEKHLLHVGRIRVAAGVMDFLSVIAGMAVVLVMVAALISLINFLVGDMGQMFTLLQRRIQ